MKLAIAPLLRTLVAEHRPLIPEALYLIVQQTVFDPGTHTTGGALGTQSEHVAVTILEGVHLFLNDIGHFADGALEQLGHLHQRHTDLVITVGVEQLAHCLFEIAPGRCLLRQDVVHAAHGLNVLAQCINSK